MNVSIACIPLNFTILVTLNQPNNIITGKEKLEENRWKRFYKHYNRSLKQPNITKVELLFNLSSW